MKKIISCIFAMALAITLLSLVPVTAYAETSGVWEYTMSVGDVIITGYNGTSNDIVIPEMIDGRKVVGIDSNTFSGYYDLVSVSLPDTLEKIGSGAFKNCVKLRSITFPEELETVGYDAFYNCEALEKITVKSKNLSDFSSSYTFENAGKETAGIEVVFTDTVTRIPAYMFACYEDSIYARVKSVSIGSAVTEIGTAAFRDCYDLQTLTIPDNSVLKTIAGEAFEDCVSLTEITLPEKLETVGYDAFYNCEALEKITVKSKSLKDFSSSYTFENAGKETAGIEVVFTDTVTKIPAYMFACYNDDEYTRIKKVTIGSGVTEIGHAAFRDCYELQMLTISDTSALKTIGTDAFSNCVSLPEITLPEELETVGYDAFYNCEALEKITVKSKSLKDFSGSYTFENAGKETDGIEVVFTDTVTKIPAYMFACYDEDEYARVVSVDMGCAVTEIGKSAFRDCYDLQTLTIPNNSVLKTIGGEAFEDCVSLTEITLPEKLETVGYDAFYNCEALGKITVKSKNLKDFSDYIFENAGKETAGIEVVFTDNVPRIPAYMFACYNDDEYIRIKKVTIGSGVTEIGQAAFRDCYDLSDVYYNGTEAQWNGVAVNKYNDPLLNATFHFQVIVSGPFVDVTSDAYYYNPVLWAVENGITNGVDATHFAPDATCTRGQIVTFLWRVMGCPEPITTYNPFRDVSDSDYFYKAVLWAYENKITSGMSDTSFAPGDPCTRGQVATFLWRSQAEPASGGNNIFSDIAPGAYYYDAVLWAVANEITNGMGDGTFAPASPCTRGQIVTFLYRAMT